MNDEPPERPRSAPAPETTSTVDDCSSADPAGSHRRTASDPDDGCELPDLDARESDRSSSRKAAGPTKRRPGRRRIERRSDEVAETRLDDDPA